MTHAWVHNDNIDRLIDKNSKDGLFRSEMAKYESIGYEL